MLLLSWAPLAVAGPFTGTVEYDISVTGAGTDATAIGMPTHVVVEVGKGITSIELQGGIAPSGRFVVEAATGRTAFVRDELRTKSWLPDTPVTPAVQWMAGEEVIEGVDTRQYRATTDGRAGVHTSFVWVAPQFKVAPKTFGAAPTPLVVAKGGLPLKVVAEQSGFAVEWVAVKVSRSSPPKERLLVPEDYEETELLP